MKNSEKSTVLHEGSIIIPPKKKLSIKEKLKIARDCVRGIGEYFAKKTR